MTWKKLLEMPEVLKYGPLPENITDKAYPGEFYKWDADKKDWVLDRTILLQHNVSEQRRLFKLATDAIKEIEETQSSGLPDPTGQNAAQLKAWQTFKGQIAAITGEELASENFTFPEPPKY